MAAKKLPSYVKKLGADGRRYFKPEFMAGLVADIRSERTTIADAEREFDLSHGLVTNWLAKNKLGKRPGRAVARALVADGGGTTLLEKGMAAMEATKAPEPGNGVDEHIAQHVELAVAYVQGRINDVGVRAALGKSSERKFMATTWLGHVLTGAIRSGWKLTR